jgi:hypothetical protein
MLLPYVNWKSKMPTPENKRRRAADDDRLADNLAKDRQAALVKDCLDKWALWDGVKVVVPPCSK